MARWRLINAHYLNTVDNQWEYKETDRTTGRQARKTFDVPRLFDPNDPADHNYPGEVIVCHEGKGQGRDYPFFGPPTPEMEPLDDEARAISDSERHKWVHPIESLPGQGFNDGLLASFQQQIAALAAGQAASATAPLPVSIVDPSAFAQMQEQVAALIAQNAELQEQLTKGRRA